MKPLLPAILLATVGLLGCSRSPSLPEASEVRAIKVIADRGKTTYVIPADDVPAILAVLRTGSKDYDPALWQTMGYDLEITTVAGNRIEVWLFKTFHEVGAFRIRASEGKWTYYRGSTDQEIAATIEKAIKASRKGD
jgi:hypothetical protein